MEMTDTRPVPAYMADGARSGQLAVASVLAGATPGLVPGADQAMASANFLANVMFTVQIANGLHPRSSVDFVPGEDRGDELARGFITAGTIEICCDYCAGLMAGSLAAAAGRQMTAVHGDQAGPQWQALAIAMTGPAAGPLP
jgi:hypothetical protein